MSWNWVSTVSRLRTHATCLPEQLATSTKNIIVCLHHGTGCSHSWLKFATSFAKKGYDVVAFDRLGYGHSPALLTRDLPREFLLESVQQVVSVLDSLGLRDPINIVGHSDGASIALMTASLFPKRVASVVSIRVCCMVYKVSIAQTVDHHEADKEYLLIVRVFVGCR